MAIQPIPDHVPAELVRDFNIFEFEGSSQDVHKAWRKIIDEQPNVFYTPVFGGFWVLNRAELLDQAWPDAELLSSADGIGIPPAPAEMPPFYPIDTDDPLHKVLRRPLNVALSPKAVKELAIGARKLAIELIDAIRPDGGCDFVRDFSLKMPMEVFLRIVDLPSDDRAYLIGLAHDAIKNPDIARRFAATNEMYAYLDGWVLKRGEQPGADLMSIVVNMDVDGRPLTHSERIGYMTNLMFGGLDTVGGTMALIAKHLAETPADRRRLAERPQDIPDAIEEMLRRFSIPTLGRCLTRDTEIGGVHMKKGERVMMPTMVHGLDDRRWGNAMEVDLDRCPRNHMAFGSGTHRCPGANLARAEIRIFLEEWLKRIPEFSIDGSREVRYQSGSVAGLLTLPLTWSVGGSGERDA
jgi:cytochrome P450